MLNYFDVIKAQSGVPVDDIWAQLWGNIMSSEYVITTYTGTLPATLTGTKAGYLESYLISGNTVQNGTPTPDNPIAPIGCGEKTENIMDVYSANGNKVTYYSGVTFDFSEEPQCITINGQSTAMYPQVQIWGKNGVLHFENGKTYTALIRTTNKPKNSLVYMLIQGCDAEGNWSTIKIVYSDTSDILFSVSKDYVNFRNIFVCQNTGITYDNMKAYLMINEGSTALPYEPYGYKLPLTSAGQNVDIYLGEVQTTRKIKKLVLTGEENWLRSTSRQGSMYFSIIDDIVGVQSMCDRAANALGIDDYTFGKIYMEKVAIKVNFLNLWLFDNDISVADFKSYLAQQYAAGTPVTVWYVLVEPETGIVNEPLMKIGDYTDTVSMEQAGVSIPTNKGTTVIDYTGTLKPSQMYIKYKARR